MSTKKPAKKQAVQTKKKANYNPVIYGGLTILAVILYYYCKNFNFIQDDSYITYRYVKNFTEGAGLVFNIGERVEGYTCFLWVILLSMLKVTGFNFISSSQSAGIIASIVTLVFTYFISSKILQKESNTLNGVILSFTAPVLLAANGSFAYWTVSGMETGLFGMLITLGIYFYLKELKKPGNIPWSAIIFLLASLTRPEGNLLFAITILHRLIYSIKNEPEGIKAIFRKSNLLWLGAYIVPALIYMLWRYSYYGYFFPNTFYAKTGSSLEYFKAGWDYFKGFAESYGIYGILLVLPLLTLRSKQKFYEYFYLVLVLYIYSAYVIFIGGDVLRPNRFFVPLLPVFYILVQEGLFSLVGLFDKKKTFTYGAALCLVSGIGFAYYTYNGENGQMKNYSELENGLVEKMKISGTWLKTKQSQAGRPLVVAATTIGAISYYSETILIDMLGLTDKEIAHNPQPIPEISSNQQIGWKERQYNVDYVLSRKPDYIYFSTGIKPSAYAERGLFTADEFMKYYYPYYFSISEFKFSDIIYKRKQDSETAGFTGSSANPNFKKSFVNLYNQAMNTTKDKTKLNEAISLYMQAAAEGPPKWSAPYEKTAEIYLQQKNTNKAFENYKKAVELDDYSVMSHYYLYQIYLQNGDTVNAQQSLEKVRKYSPDIFN